MTVLVPLLNNVVTACTVDVGGQVSVVDHNCYSCCLIQN